MLVVSGEAPPKDGDDVRVVQVAVDKPSVVRLAAPGAGVADRASGQRVAASQLLARPPESILIARDLVAWIWTERPAVVAELLALLVTAVVSKGDHDWASGPSAHLVDHFGEVQVVHRALVESNARRAPVYLMGVALGGLGIFKD